MCRSRAADRRGLALKLTGAAAVVLLVGALAGVASLWDDGETLEPRISDPIATTTTRGSATSAPPSTAAENAIAVIPGLDERTAAELEALPHPGVTVLTEATLTEEVITDIRTALNGLDSSRRNEPLQAHAAFEKDGMIHTVIEYSSDRTALMVVENGEAVRFRDGEGAWIDVHGLRKDTTAYWFAFTQVTWLGLPENAATARLTTPQRPRDIEAQAVIGGAAFFEIAKPDWTQIGTVTLFNADGNAIMTDEMRLHGTSCSAAGVAPASPNLFIPDTLEAGRIALADALDGCRSGTIASLAVGSGPYFDLPMDDLAAGLRDADQRSGLFRPMSRALRFGPREVETQERTIHLFSWNTDSGEQVELGFTEDGVWQFGRFVEQ